MTHSTAVGSPATDRIEKTRVLGAPRSRVWRALVDAGEFGAWFRAEFDGDFREGQVTSGRMTMPGYEHVVMEVLIEKIEPERYFAFRWHPYAESGGVDFERDPVTLVEFHLEETSGGTRLTIVESGFDRVPVDKRGKAMRDNDQGWTHQLGNVERHVTRA